MRTPISTIDSKNVIKTLTILLLSMITGIVIFSLVSIVVIKTNGPFLHEKETAINLFGILLLFSAIVIYFLRAFYSRKMKALSASAVNTSEKVNLYKSTFIKFMAVAEVIGISGVTGFLLTGQYLFFVVAGMALVQMLQKMPAESKFNL
jgi:predicted lysophospholipase L1 biosynthesis ABC-type transport system permease subunit